ncbi:hypothetical protein PHLCEN_2v3635 [Hermanssonia centrifuga]|uniref:Uncharacterized protein n=1 Tax=Hermanssonia centrifuga TaxID=98765 RepID=A0A2R6QEL5_9APHY|nr:hypothetical protein PHLCEN_2v3635 [Hermanssonia centrifuga]
MGICMDLNTQPPALWTLEDGPYEIAQHCLEKKANVLLLLNAWLDSKEEREEPKDWRTLNFWAARLRPLWARTEELEDEDSDSDKEEGLEHSASQQNHPGQETIVIVCNRSGVENGQTFAGTSAVFSMRRGSGRPRLLHSMDRKSEGVEIWTV